MKFSKLWISLAVIMLICCFTLLGEARYSKALAYDNSTFSGPWIGCENNPSDPNLLPCSYMVSDGRGTITDMGVFFPPDVMSYSVSSSGRMSVSLGNMASGTGQLTSNNTGYIDYYVQNQTLRNEIVKVSDAGAMQGTWSGSLGDYSVSFDVDSSGVVQNFSGIAGPVSGKIYSHNGSVAGFLRTGLPESN